MKKKNVIKEPPIWVISKTLKTCGFHERTSRKIQVFQWFFHYYYYYYYYLRIGHILKVRTDFLTF